MQISEISKKFNVSPDTLRYYERIGLIPPVHRTSSGIRDYSEYDENCIEFITRMRSAGMPIEVLLEYIGLLLEGDSTVVKRKDLLKKQREILAAKIENLKQTMKNLDYKIDYYEEIILKAERFVGSEKIVV